MHYRSFSRKRNINTFVTVTVTVTVPIGYQSTRHSTLSCDEWTSCLTKVTICAGFSGTVLIFNHVPEKTSQFSWDAHLSRFCLMPRICPNLPISAAACLHIGGQKLAQILSVYTKKVHWWPRARGAHDAPPETMTDPRWLVLVVLAPYDLRRQSSRIAVPIYGHFMYNYT